MMELTELMEKVNKLLIKSGVSARDILHIAKEIEVNALIALFISNEIKKDL